MKSIVVVAYYHLMHAMALALTFDQKPNLYLCVEYTNMDDGVVENIRKSGVFNEVIKLDTREFIFDFVPELRKTKKAEPEEIREIGSSLFDEYIDAYYYPKFQGADFDEEIYIYTEYHLMMYSISKHFNNIVLCEDGYKVMAARLKAFSLTGYFKLLPPFIELGFYPPMQFQCEKIHRLICSGDYKDLPPALKEKVEVRDFKDLVAQNREAYRSAIKTVFAMEDVRVQDGAILLIEQPLYRTDYCSDLRYVLFYRKLIRQLAENHQVLIKPHPAGTKCMDIFRQENVEVIRKDIPVECLNYVDATFDSVVTFYSSSLDLLENTREQRSLYDIQKIEKGSLKNFVLDYIGDEKLSIGLYLYCSVLPEGIQKELLGIFKKAKRFSYHVTLLCPEELVGDITDVAEKTSRKVHKNIPVIKVEAFDQGALLRLMVEHREEYDYQMVLSGTNRASDVRRIVKNMCKGSMGYCIGVHQRCGSTITICNPLSEHILTGIVNVFWSRELLDIFCKEGIVEMHEALEYVYANRISTDHIGNEYLSSELECRDDLMLLADHCKDKALGEIYSAYYACLDYLRRRKDSTETLVERGLEAFFDTETIDKEAILKILFTAYNVEHGLNVRHFRRVRWLENNRLVSIALSLRRVKVRLMKKVKRILKRIKK